MPRRTGSSQRWRQRQERDIYVEQATRAGWRSRAVFKLEQIQDKERLLKPGAICVDLGSAPGSWSQLAVRLVGSTGRVIAIDLLPMEPIPGVEFLQGDFTAPETLESFRNLVGPKPVDLVMSDMAPNMSGNRTIDQPRSLALLDEALAFAREVLKPGGDLLFKAFQGEGIDEVTRELKRDFKTVKTLKPKASRPESREIYLLARSFGM
ncbi:MAG TPA: RlmE family RNA methyltransferase [Gammaproteobacteria bacterium]|jgi:23S rRNA (uridine2552-2'-O)-methyltransferase|nr:RlmE family RNA methyltransferase [Gammaproteobacteria bacterium]